MSTRTVKGKRAREKSGKDELESKRSKFASELPSPAPPLNQGFEPGGFFLVKDSTNPVQGEDAKPECIPGLTSTLALGPQSPHREWAEMPPWGGFSKVSWKIAPMDPPRPNTGRSLVLGMSTIKPLPGEDARALQTIKEEELVANRTRHAIRQAVKQVHEIKHALSENHLALEKSTADGMAEPDDLYPLVLERQHLKKVSLEMDKRTEVSFSIDRGEFTAEIPERAWIRLEVGERMMDVFWVPGIESDDPSGGDQGGESRVVAGGGWEEIVHTAPLDSRLVDGSNINPSKLRHVSCIQTMSTFTSIAVSRPVASESFQLVMSAPSKQVAKIFDLALDKLGDLIKDRVLRGDVAEKTTGVAISRENKFVVACCSDYVQAHRLDQGAIAAKLQVADVSNIAVDGKCAYIVPHVSGRVTVVSLPSLKIERTFSMCVRYPSIAVDEKHIFIADGYGTYVAVFTKLGQRVQTIQIAPSSDVDRSRFNAMIAVDRDYIYVADGDREIVTILHKEGGRVSRVLTVKDTDSDSGTTWIPHGVAVCDGHLFVCDWKGKKLHIFNCSPKMGNRQQVET